MRECRCLQNIGAFHKTIRQVGNIEAVPSSEEESSGKRGSERSPNDRPGQDPDQKGIGDVKKKRDREITGRGRRDGGKLSNAGTVGGSR
jgi:hypothetical protein